MCVVEAPWASMIPTRKAPLPAAFRRRSSPWFVPKMTSSSAPEPPPESTMSIRAWLPATIAMTYRSGEPVSVPVELPRLSSVARPCHGVTGRATPSMKTVLSLSLTTIVLLPVPPVRTAASKMPPVFSTVAPAA